MPRSGREAALSPRSLLSTSAGSHMAAIPTHFGTMTLPSALLGLGVNSLHVLASWFINRGGSGGFYCEVEVRRRMKESRDEGRVLLLCRFNQVIDNRSISPRIHGTVFSRNIKLPKRQKFSLFCWLVRLLILYRVESTICASGVAGDCAISPWECGTTHCLFVE